MADHVHRPAERLADARISLVLIALAVADVPADLSGREGR
jgi:hypothetical protein